MRTNATAQDSAIAFLLAQHVQEQAQAFLAQEPVVVRNAPRQTNKSKKSASEPKADPIHQPEKPANNATGIILPEKGTLDALSFMMAARNAGKRLFPVKNEATGETKMILKFDATEVRNDLIRAIAGFIGYDGRQDFGAQEIAARTQAKKALNPIRQAPPPVKVPSSLQGYVAGMPDMMARKLQDLLAREAACVESICVHEKEASKALQLHAPNREQATFALGMASAERERLVVIREELKKF